MKDTDKQHDPLDQNAEEAELEAEEIASVTDTGEVQPAEEAAVNIDTEVAREATEKTAETDEELVSKRKSKRQSTSEKAKLAMAEKARRLDPLRLRGKKYRAKFALIVPGKAYPAEEALDLAKQVSVTSFDGAIELHCQVKSDTLRGTVSLPHGSGKTKKVAVATDEVIEEIAAGKLNFDVLLATPTQMSKLSKYAKLLGPKGLMPSPKAGTVTEEIEKVSAEIQGGRVEYRADKNGVVHLSIGRVSFPTEALLENYKVLEQVLTSAKIISMSVSPTMGPGIRIAIGK